MEVYRIIIFWLYDTRIVHAVLFSNIKLNSKSFQKISPLWSLIVSSFVIFLAIKNDTFLRLNKSLKYKGKPMYIKEFAQAGIIEAHHAIGKLKPKF